MLYPYGNNLKLYIEGGSHDEKIELLLDGFPSGLNVNLEELARFMQRRAPGRDKYSTQRIEDDMPEFLSGFNGSETDGSRIHAGIRNRDCHPSDYSQVNDIPRPSHADYAAIKKYGESVDLRGGGHFSGRLTAALCVAGGLCKQYLSHRGAEIFAHIYSIGEINDIPFDLAKVGEIQRRTIAENVFPVLDRAVGEKMKNAVLQTAQRGDSLGGVVECAVTGLVAGLGEHMFAGVEGRIASILFSVPAVKGVEFGLGFGSTKICGSQNNDFFETDGKTVRTVTNNCGGVLGGMTDSMPVVFRAAFKPTPSIAAEQQSVSLSRMENVKLSITGRHDPCIVPRAVPVIEAAAAVAVCDILLDGSGERADG